MSDLNGLGKFLILVGVLLLVAGAVVTVGGKLPGLGSGFGWVGRLPGDIYIKRNSFSFYAPLTTCLLISAALSLCIYIISSLWKH